MQSRYKGLIVLVVAVICFTTYWTIKIWEVYKIPVSPFEPVCVIPGVRTFNLEPDKSRRFGIRTMKRVRTLYVEPDKSRRFGIIRNVFNSTEPNHEHDVAIVTHMDISKLQLVPNLADHWLGPIHLCIFVTSECLLQDTLSLLNRLRNTKVNTKKFVNFHILYPLKDVGPNYEHYIEKNSFTGKNKQVVELIRDNYSMSLEEELTELNELNFNLGLKGSNRDRLAFYPHTIAMNVALSESKSIYFLSMDCDLTPSKNMRNKFISFAEEHNLFADSKPYPPLRKVGRVKKESDGVCFYHDPDSLPPPDIYVVPTFMTKDEKTPRTVRKLRASVEAKHSTFFYGGLFDPSYGPTRHGDWLKQSDDAEDAKTECIYEVEYRADYEPFVIARNSVPFYDERFSGFSQVEDHHKKLLGTLGYKFKVLRNVFLVHEGWKLSAKLTGQKKIEADFHHKDWEAFLNEISQLSRQEVYEGFLES